MAPGPPTEGGRSGVGGRFRVGAPAVPRGAFEKGRSQWTAESCARGACVRSRCVRTVHTGRMKCRKPDGPQVVDRF